jgi:hypothetical protein
MTINEMSLQQLLKAARRQDMKDIAAHRRSVATAKRRIETLSTNIAEQEQYIQNIETMRVLKTTLDFDGALTVLYRHRPDQVELGLLAKDSFKGRCLAGEMYCDGLLHVVFFFTNPNDAMLFKLGFDNIIGWHA